MAESIAAAGGALEYTATSEWDLSAKQYLAVHVGGSDNYVKVASAAGVKCIGVLQNKPTSGRAARVRTSGVTKMVAGAAITRNENIDVGATGYARTAAGSNYIGIALETAVTSATFKMLLTRSVT
jgi:hypothetical protein